MKMVRILALCALVAGTVAAGYTADQTWTGSLVDASCYLKDGASMASGNDHMGTKSCGTTCLKLGQPAGIVTADKKFILLIVPSPSVAEYAGEPIRVTGTIKSGAIVVSKFEVKKGDGWKVVKLPAMM
jgi:hypothetical protein